MLIIGVVSTQIFRLYTQNIDLKKTADKLGTDIENISKENQQLLSDLNYFNNTENLEKELREKLNLKNPGEQLLIIVPSKATSTQ